MKPIESLFHHLPEVFDQRQPRTDWGDEYIFVPIDNPDQIIPPIEEMSAPVILDESLLGEGISDALSVGLEGEDDESTRILVEAFEKILEAFTGGAAGAPEPPPERDNFIPPDCLAFYLPFHYHYPDWWGIYLVHEGVEWLANKLSELDGGSLPPSIYRIASRRFLYHHEFYHHRVESLAARLESVHRGPAYITGFEAYFNFTSGGDGWWEEALANAYAYQKVAANFTTNPQFKAHILNALEQYIQGTPPGYRMGMEFVPKSAFESKQNLLAEESLNLSYFREDEDKRKDPSLWGSASFMTRGFDNVKSRTHYVIPRNSSLAGRIPNHFVKRPREVIKALDKLVGMSFVRQKGSHAIYKTKEGRQFPIPIHPGDLNRKLLRGLIKQAGLDMSLSEFLRHC